MHQTLNELRGQLTSVRTVRPRREQTLRELADQADIAREELRGVEGALNSLAELEADRTRFRAQAEKQAFLRGRIDAHLSQLPDTGDAYAASCSCERPQRSPRPKSTTSNPNSTPAPCRTGSITP
ncbi:hypothetical protein [Streptomyces sp. NPDC001089]